MSWHRVTRKCKCPVCQHDNWCFVSEDGKSALCMRVQSPKAHTFKTLETGWIHRLEGDFKPLPTKPKREEPKLSAQQLEDTMNKYYEWTTAGQITQHAKELGVRASALAELNVAYSHDQRAFAWPMKDWTGNLVGIRFRNQNGDKWSLRGGTNGLFYPNWGNVEYATSLWICEGGSDTAALRSMNLMAIGRPSCSGGMVDIKRLVDVMHLQRVYIIADNDKPGLDGADALARNIPVPSCVMTLPCKDVRKFYSLGGDAEMLVRMSSTFKWRNAK